MSWRWRGGEEGKTGREGGAGAAAGDGGAGAGTEAAATKKGKVSRSSVGNLGV